MIYLSRTAIVVLFGIAAYHAFGAALLFLTLATGHTTDWQLFGVVDCCDIPLYEIQLSTASAAAMLAAIDYMFRWLLPGLWKFKEWAWWSAFALCFFLILVHLQMTEGKMEFVKAIHYKFIALCCVPLVLLLLSAPLYFKAPEESDNLGDQ